MAAPGSRLWSAYCQNMVSDPYSTTGMALGKCCWLINTCLGGCLELYVVVQLGSDQMNKMDGGPEEGLPEKNTVSEEQGTYEGRPERRRERYEAR